MSTSHSTFCTYAQISRTDVRTPGRPKHHSSPTLETRRPSENGPVCHRIQSGDSKLNTKQEEEEDGRGDYQVAVCMRG